MNTKDDLNILQYCHIEIQDSVNTIYWYKITYGRFMTRYRARYRTNTSGTGYHTEFTLAII